MLTGSFASSYHGSPRTTQDVDLVIRATRDQLNSLLDELPPEDYYVSGDAAREAASRRSQFNVIDMVTGWKADLIFIKDRPFSQEEFARRVRGTVLGVELWIATAEDAIVSKLERASKGQSERQLRDVVGIIRGQRDSLDGDYISRWCDELGVSHWWARAIEASSQLGDVEWP